MHHSYKNSGRNVKTERDSRAATAIELRSQKRHEMLQKKRTATISRGPSMYNLSELAEKINSANTDVIIEGITEMRRLLCAEKLPPIDAMVSLGLTPIFRSLINTQNPIYSTMPQEKMHKILHETTWVLTNITSGNTEQTMAVLNSGAHLHLIELLKVGTPEIQDQALWTIGNIAGDCETTRDILINNGATDPIISLVQRELCSPNEGLAYLKNQAWVLSNINRGRNPPPPLDHMEKCLGVLIEMVNIDDPEINADVYWAIGYICDAGVAAVDMVLKTGIVEIIVGKLALYQSDTARENKALMQFRDATVSPITRILGNIVTYEDRHTDYILSLGVLPLLRKIFNISLEHKKVLRLKKEVCWVISNITAGSAEQMDQVIREGFLEILVSTLKNADNLTRLEACWALCNATMNLTMKMKQFREIFQSGVISAYEKYLPTVKNDPKIAKILLESITSLLECGKTDSLGGENQVANEIEDSGLLEQIEELQSVNNYTIAFLAESIIRSYFDGQ